MHATDSAAVFQARGFGGCPAVIIGTGPSLDPRSVKAFQEKTGARLFGVNNTFNDFELDCWIACDPAWHDTFSPVRLDCDQWHWDKRICDRHGYRYIEGRWGDGLSTDPAYIHYGHSSGYQALNLAVHYGCGPIVLVGYDMHYNGSQRHYFAGISDKAGEYPAQLRKFSAFDGLIRCYETIARQQGLPPIINCTPGSALTCFPMATLDEVAQSV